MCRLPDKKQGQFDQPLGFSKDRNFAVARKFETPPTADLEVELQPVARLTGRLIKQDGNPASNARVYFGDKVYAPNYGGFVMTDEDGRFEITEVCPNVDLKISSDHESEDKYSQGKFLPINVTELAPGETRSLGDFKIQPRVKMTRNW